MTEEEARAWVAARHSPAIVARIETVTGWIVEENGRQNLISPASVPSIWSRHIVDSLQLLDLAERPGPWLDIGTGGGFPGLIVAVAGAAPMTLVEPRRKRAQFLSECVDRLALPQVTVLASRIEQVECEASIISARAVASLEKLLPAAAHCATTGTQWLLPRGTVDPIELAALAVRHGMMFHVEQSLTQAESAIVVLKSQ